MNLRGNFPSLFSQEHRKLLELVKVKTLPEEFIYELLVLYMIYSVEVKIGQRPVPKVQATLDVPRTSDEEKNLRPQK